MKRVLLSFAAIFLLKSLFAQDIVFENFNSTPIGSVPPGWTVFSNTDVANYTRPFECTASDKGLQTPGVGKNAPTRMVLPLATYDVAKGIITITFRVWVLDANLNCTSVKEFPCPTYVGAYLIKTTADGSKYADGSNIQINNLPATANIFDSRSYQLVQANASNTIIFNAPNMTNGDKFRVYLDFKTAENSDCTSSGTKFIFDDISVKKSDCVNCIPVVQNDFFRAEDQAFFNSLKGNVLGGNLQWSSSIPSEFSEPSLSIPPAINDGLDFDLNAPDLSEMTFSLVSGPTVTTTQSCSVSPVPAGTLIFNSNGTFTYTRGDVCVKTVTFTYKLRNNSTQLESSTTATVTIEFPDNASLPVTFSNFHAQRNRDKVALKWETLSEQNNRGFNVQRNTRGVWETVAFVFSQAEGGNSATALSYEFRDANSEKGVSQYRIQQVDLDGRASYSAIRSVKGLEQAVTRTVVYPNPSADGKVSVVFEDQGAKAVVVSDMSGRIIRQYRNVLNNVLIEGLESGMYSIQVTDLSSAVSSTEKVIIKKR